MIYQKQKQVQESMTVSDLWL